MVTACIECSTPATFGPLGGSSLTRGLCPRCYTAALKAAKPPTNCMNCGQVRRIVCRGICTACAKRAKRQREAGQPVTVKMLERSYKQIPPRTPAAGPATLQKPSPATDGRLSVHLPVDGLDLWMIVDPPADARQFEKVRAAIPKAGATLLRWARDRMLRGSGSKPCRPE